MVQTRIFAQRQAKNYWKLLETRSKAEACRLLDSRGLAYYKNVSVERAKYLYLRAQRDLHIYDKCTVEELQQFCVARGIQSQVLGSRSKKRTVDILIARLEQADETATFEKFLDLPAELRLLVYGHYLVDTHTFSQSLAQLSQRKMCFDFVQPPITSASRLIRRESLPEFYKTFDFLVGILQDHRPVLFPGCRNFIPRAPREVLDRLQTISFAGRLRITYVWPMTHFQEDREARIEMKTGSIEVVDCRRWSDQKPLLAYQGRDLARERHVMEQRVKRFVKDRQQPGETIVTLRVGDWAGIGALFEPLYLARRPST